MLRIKKQARLYALLTILALILSSSISLQASSNSSRLDTTRIKFSNKVAAGFGKIAKSMDASLCRLATRLNEKAPISLKINAHFYDKRARRYFLSFSGNLKYSGKLSFAVKNDHYYLSSDGLLSYDIELSDVKKTQRGVVCNYTGVFVISIEDLAYKVSKDIPNLVAAGVFSPATDLLVTFFNELNTGLIAEATAKTLVKFSRVALTKLGADLINAAGKNKEVLKFVRVSMKDGSMLSFLALTIVRSAATGVVKVYGASLGATVGSMVAPGVGTTIGAFLGSSIATMIANAVVYKTMVEFPIKRSLRKVLVCQKLLKHNPSLKEVAAKVKKNTMLILKKIKREFSRNKFKLFDMVLKKIDRTHKNDRVYYVPLLNNLKEILRFRIINEGDWYYAKRYYQLKTYVGQWGLESKLRFNIKK